MIWLRELDESDRSRLFRWRNLHEVRRWMYTDHMIQRDEHDRWFASALIDPSRKYWIIMHDEEPIGVVNLIGLGNVGDTCSFGIYLGEQRARGTGAAKIALEKALQYAFDVRSLPCVAAEVLQGNRKAERLYEQVGMRSAGKAVLAPGGKAAKRYEISRQHWLQLHTQGGSVI